MQSSASDYWWLSLLIPIVGKVLADRNSKKLATRKEIRDRIDELTKLVEDLQRECYFYYHRPGNDPEIFVVGQSIRCKAKQVGTRVAMLNTQLPDFGLVTQGIRFRQAVSAELDNANRPAFAAGHGLYDNVSNTGGTLVAALERAFEKRFK